MGNWWRDVRYGFRMLANNKGFTAVAVLALALGIGPNVAIFSIVWATFLAPLPYPHPDQLVVVWNKAKGERSPTRSQDYLQYLAQSRSFQRLDFIAWDDVHLTNPDHSQEEIAGQMETPDMYSKAFGIPMLMGRDLLPQDAVHGRDHVVVLTYKLWQERFHADPAILGKPILVNDEPYTVVGVVNHGVADRIPARFLVPVVVSPAPLDLHWGGIIGRLKPGVSRAQAQAELAVIDRQLATTRRGNLPQDAWTISVEQLKNDWLDKKLERNLWLLLAAVGCVLLIACANVANLLLARGSARQQELAVRSAMGATRQQVFAQLLTESLTLAILGGALGIGMGWALIKLIMAILPDLALETAEAVVQMNLPVLCFAVGVTLVGGVLFGCAPAWQAAKLNLSETLKQGSRSVTGRGPMRTQAILVITEFALALTLLGGAGMALHSFWKLSQIDLGVRTDHILTAVLRTRNRDRQSQAAVTPAPAQINANARQLLDKLGTLPGVRGVALTTTLPMKGRNAVPFNIVGRTVADTDRPVADFQIVTPSYFSTFGIRLAQGRFLSDDDTADSPQTVVVNESFVRRFLPGVNPLNQRLILQFGPNQKPGPSDKRQIVGVFHDVLNGEHLTDNPLPQILLPFWQNPWGYDALAVRTAQDPATVLAGIRGVIAESTLALDVTQVETMQHIVDAQRSGDRFAMTLFGGFAAVALLLAALGIYGVMSFSVAQRTHEIGLRMALGAQRHEVVLLMVKGGMKLALLGVGIGLVGVLALGRLMRNTLYGVQTIDPASFAAVALVLLAVAVIACYLPARRSAEVDPMIALRQE